MVATFAESLRQRLGTTWCIAESGLAGPTTGRSGLPPGRTNIAVAGPVSRSETMVTGSDDREANMIEFTTLSLRYLRDAIRAAPAKS
jgi:nicotinamide mononucleotide (NMN) deamidase PncC